MGPIKNVLPHWNCERRREGGRLDGKMQRRILSNEMQKLAPGLAQYALAQSPNGHLSLPYSPPPAN